jgi:hypothetical protein
MAGGVGYVKLWRAFLDSEQMSDDWLCRLFVWCILRANFEPSKFKGMDLSPGQFVTGRISAASELKVSPSKWYRGIERLAEMGAIKVSANSNWTTLTLCNWQTYQSGDNKSEQPADSERTAGDTTSGQRVIQRADTDKEGKKERREEGNNIPPNPQGGKSPKKAPAVFSIEIPESLRSPQFIEAWEKWQKHRREIRKPLTETQAGAQMAKFKSIGSDRAVAAIDHTIEMGWQGIREPDMPGAAKGSGKSGDFFSGFRDFAEGRHK